MNATETGTLEATTPFINTTPFVAASLTTASLAANDSAVASGGGMSPLNGFRIFVCTVGVIGNVSVILMILIFGEFKKGITLWYILQLAIADSIFLLTLPFKIIQAQRGSWDYPEWMCKGSQSILFINYYCSVTFLTIMAVDRYLAVCHRFSERLQKLRTHKVAYITTAAVWVISILISIPVMMYSSVRGTRPRCTCQLQFPEPQLSIEERCIEYGLQDQIPLCRSIIESLPVEEVCAPPTTSSSSGPVSTSGNSGDTLDMNCNYLGHPVGYRAFLYFNFIMMFIIPFLVIATCYSLIIRHLKKTAFRDRSDSNASMKDRSDRNRIVTMCATLVIVFTVCWLPYHSVHMAKMKGIRGSATYCINLSLATTFLVYVNSAVNPFIYFIVTRFKTQLRRMRESLAASGVLAVFTRRSEVDSSSAAASGHSNQTAPVREADSLRAMGKNDTRM